MTRDIQGRATDSGKFDGAWRKGGKAFAIMLASALFMGAHMGVAQAVQRSFLNLGFEEPTMNPNRANNGAGSCESIVIPMESGLVPGWKTTHATLTDGGHSGRCTLTSGQDYSATGKMIDIWYTGKVNGIPSYAGNQLAELNALDVSRIYQSVCLLPDDEIGWYFSHRARTSSGDTAVFRINDSNGALLWDIAEVTSDTNGNGNVDACSHGTCAPAAKVNTWSYYEGNFTWTQAAGEYQFGFEALGNGGGQLDYGNLIDEINISGLVPFVELEQASGEGEEGTASPGNILVSGEVKPGETLTVTLAVIDGTATGPADYSGGPTVTITIPEGTYDAEPFAIPVSILTDQEKENREQFTIEVVENEAAYIISSTSQCGGAGIDSMTYTILDAHMEITKAAVYQDTNGDGFASDGDTIQYTFTVTNTGDVDLTNVTVTDPTVPVTGGPIATLAAGATDSTTFTAAPYTITQADVDSGSVENQATVTGTAPGGQDVTDMSSDPNNPDGGPDGPTVTELAQEPALELVKTGTFNDDGAGAASGNGFAEPGETISYTFTLTNNGNVPITGVTLTDDFITANGGQITGGPIRLEPQGTDSTTFTATYTITENDIAAGGVTNLATATGTDPSGQDVTAQSHDGSGTPGTGTFTELKQGAPALDLLKRGAFQDDMVPNGYAEAGETITYTFTLENKGDVKISGIVVTDPRIALPAMTPVDLEKGGTHEFTFDYTITDADIDAGGFENTAVATGTDTSGKDVTATSHDENGNAGTEVVLERGSSAYTVVKSSGAFQDANGNGYADEGETITYTFKAMNLGDVVLSDVGVEDARIGYVSQKATLQPKGTAGDTHEFTFDYAIKKDDLEEAMIENVAVATATDPTGQKIPQKSHPEGKPPGTPTVTDIPHGDSDFIKTSVGVVDHNGDGVTGNAGDRINYAFTIVNLGNVAIEAFAIDDPGAVIEGTLAAPIPVGGQDDTSFTGYHVITQEEIDAGSFTNLAEGTATTTGGGTFTKTSRNDKEGSKEGDATETPLEATPGIETELVCTPKDTNGTGIIDAGDKLQCDVIVTNNGNVTLNDVAVAGVETPGVPGATTPLADVAGGPIPVLKPGESNKTNFTVEYTLTQEDLDAGGVLLQVEGVGTPPPKADGSPADPVTDLSDDPANTADEDLDGDGTPDDPAHVRLPEEVKLKVTDKETVMPEGFPKAGDVIEYRVTIDNVGNVTAKDVKPKDRGPTFAGKPGTGTLSAFEPAAVAALQPADAPAIFTAFYTLSAEDVARSAGQPEGVQNTASAEGGSARSGKPIDNVEPATTKAELPSFGLTKQSRLSQARRGERVPYTITMRPVGIEDDTQSVTLIDTMPPGFIYVEGSASIDGVAVRPEQRGRELVFENVPYTVDTEEIVVELSLAVSAALKPGEYANQAKVIVDGVEGQVISPIAKATVEVVPEPVFDCGDLIGRVFDDINRNGYQDEGEPGLAGARVATVDGLLLTTDAHGRFHVACADMPDGRIGSTYLMKLDPRTLPTGYRIVSENPRTVRLTAGKASRLNFAAALSRVVRVDLNDAAFEPGMQELKPEWQVKLPLLIALLEPEESVLRLAYVDAGADRKLAANRMKHIRRAIDGMWKEKPGRYRLEIETKIELSK